jgi:hypothetical protein
MQAVPLERETKTHNANTTMISFSPEYHQAQPAQQLSYTQEIPGCNFDNSMAILNAVVHM